MWPLRAVQAVVLILPLVLHYFGSHTMGAHRHFKVRGDVYLGGILRQSNLTIAAIVLSVILVLLVFRLIAAKKRRLQAVQTLSELTCIGLTITLMLLCALPVFRTVLIYPWLLLCAAVLWLLQLVKLLLHQRSCTNDDPSDQN
ncbi:MAG TPA: hypothetical protein VN538_01390 [Clostridia bacterium]|nr:hypothetical protein [Clostridia bacterium]